MTKLVKIFCAASALILSACRADLVPAMQEGALQVSLGYVSCSVAETKTAPENLAKPDASNFQLNIVNKDRSNTLYNGKFTDTPIKAVPGSYIVSVQAGEDVEIGYDSPFYTGSANANVPVDAMVPTPVNIQCKVANSRISVVFGGDALERARFSALFEECEMIVDIGSKKISIDMPGQSRSVYLRAGQDFTLSFRGILKKDPDHTVFTYLNTDGLPSSLNAADHLIITLNPSHDSGAGIEISKIELTEAEIGSTIPFSWLPVPKVSAQHVFDQDGTLLGTKLETESSFPGCKWMAEVRNAGNVVVRTLTGENSLSSDYDASQDWPYIPSGNYTVSFSYEFNGNTYSHPKTGQLVVPSPEALVLELEGGYTSYDLYKKGDISGANACDKGTIYAPTAKVAISENILSNSNYINLPVTYIAKVDNNQLSSTKNQHINTQKMDNAINLVSKADAYEYSVEVKFDGCSSTKSENHYITGLPVTYTPPSDSYGWSWVKQQNGSWNDDGKLKLACTVTPASEAKTPTYYVKDDVNIKVTSDVQKNADSPFDGNSKYVITLFSGPDSKYEPGTSKSTTVSDFTFKAPSDGFSVKYTYYAAGYYLWVYTVKIEYR